MAKKKIISYYKDMYLGSLTATDADSLLAIRSQSVIPSLKNCIYNLSEDTIERIERNGKYSLEQTPLNPEEEKLGELRDYQTVGVAYSYIAKRMILGDSAGLGKTIQMAGLINLCIMDNNKKSTRPFRYIFLTEKNSIKQISYKLMKTTGEYVHYMTGEQKYVDPFIEGVEKKGVWCSLVASHSVVGIPKFIKWLYTYRNYIDLLVLDESYVVKKTSSDIHKTIKKISEWFDRFIMLNATFFETTIEDCYNQLSIIDSSMLPVRAEFESTFCKKVYTGYKPKIVGYKNEDLFKKRICLRYLARTRKELGAKFENNNGYVLFSKLSSEQKDLIKKTTLWRMVCDCPTVLDEDLAFDMETVPKLKDLLNVLRFRIEERDTVLIYCYYKEAQYQLKDYLEAEGFEVEIINGSTRIVDKNTIVEGFNNKVFKVLITNVQRSIDLVSCDYLIYYSFDCNPQKMVQTEGRITREFDIEDKTVIVLCSEGREEQYLRNIVRRRAIQGARVTNRDMSIVLDILEDFFNKNNKGKVE